jgi:asparagine synthase (glutamine-hydrolysing)
MRGAFTPEEADQLVAYYLDAEAVGFADNSFGAEPPRLPNEKDCVSFMETTRYMQNQLLRDSDVMSMAWGLELRVPFVDRALYEHVCRLPAEQRLRPGKALILKAVPEVPEWIAAAPKRGFSFPFEDWLGDQWDNLFQATDRRSPVRLGSWYRRWMLFTLDHFLKTNGISGRLLAA